VPDQPLRIVHCDDSPSFLMLARHWLEDHPDLEITYSALGVRDAIEHVRALQPDVVITDTFGSAHDATYLGWLHDAAPSAQLVILTGYREDQLGEELRVVADAVVTKQHDERELVAALRRLTGER
jgi:DNA-binding NarL/FixJ family response regulator